MVFLIINPNIRHALADSPYNARRTSCERAASSCPVCSPYRAMMQTGRYPISTGVTSNCRPEHPEIYLKGSEQCIGDVLKKSGYSTGYIGKWHLSKPNNPHPQGAGHWDAFTPPGSERQGFDFWYSYGTNGEHWNPWYFRDENKRIKHEGWSTTHETDMAIEFIRTRDKEKPFALFLSWNPPHPPYVCPKKDLEHYKGIELKKRPNFDSDSTKRGGYRGDPFESMRSYYGAITSVDREFGRLMEALSEMELDENTIVVYTADHGEMMGSHGLMEKLVPFEEALGIPFMIRWPNKIPVRRDDAVVFDAVDIMPTLLSLMDLNVPSAVEGENYSKQFQGKESPSGKPRLIQDGRDNRVLGAGRWRGLRSQHYTYIVDLSGGTFRWIDRLTYENRKPTDELREILFDLKNDPYQMNPITRGQGYDALMDKHRKQLEDWLKKTGDPFLENPSS